MAVSITLGRYNADRINAAEEFAIPVLDAVLPMQELYATVQSALHAALQLRTGILVIGPKQCGKSTALDRAVRELRDEEQRLLAAMPESYRERRVLTVHGLNSKTPRELLIALLQQVSPGLKDRHMGMRKSDDALRTELVVALLNKNYGLIVLDEAEYLTDRAVDQLRKLMADAAERDGRRVISGEGGEAYKAAGVGILLVGTSKLLDVVRRDDDAGHRWSDVMQVNPLTLPAIGDCYLAIFPGFSPHVAEIGTAAWREFCANHAAVGQRLSVGTVVLHARRYYAAFQASDLADGLASVAREHIPFNRELFLYTLTDGTLTNGSKPKGKA
jgi:hypothetical protein